MACCSDRYRVVLIGCDCGEAVHDWLWLSEGCERQELWLFYICSHVFPIKWRHRVSCSHSLEERELDAEAI